MCNCNQNNPCGSQQPCTQLSCTCPVLISSDCVNNVTEDLSCSGIIKGQTLTEALVQLDAFVCDKFNSITDFITIENIGTGADIYKGVSLLGKKQLRSLLDSGLINIVEGVNEITISVDEAALDAFIQANYDTTALLHTTGNETKTGNLTVNSIIKAGGTPSQYLMADGSISSLPYLSYQAIISQAGTGDPGIITLVSNNLGATILWTRSTTGTFLATASSPIFTADKTFHFLSTQQGTSNVESFKGVRNSSTVYQISQHNKTTDALMDNVPVTLVEIRVYN